MQEDSPAGRRHAMGSRAVLGERHQDWEQGNQRACGDRRCEADISRCVPRRCLVPAQGYFEWKGEAQNKQPYFIRAPDHTLLLFAGLWEHWWPVKDAEPVLTFTIVTGPPGIVSGDIHDRAPLILPPESWEPWLAGTVDDAKRIVDSTAERELTYYPVSKAVGAPRNDRPELVEQVAIT